MMDRRDLFVAGVASGAVSVLASEEAEAADRAETPGKMIDTNVSLFQWPFRRLPLDETELLIEKLRWLGITEAWAGSFEGVLHRDVTGVNKRLAEACSRYPETPCNRVDQP